MTPCLFFLIIVLIYSLYYTALVVLLLYASKKLKKQRSGYKPFISVIIAARNEENLIGRCLENLQKQTYDKSKFEVIVVNDRSQDRTPEIVLEFQKKHGIFRLINIKEVPLGTSPKKYSLSNGIEKARGQIIVTTDADSIVPVAWLERISNYIGEELTLVLGFVYIHPDSSLNNFLGTFDSLELFAFSTVSAFSTGLSFPISANSSNMAYSRKLFNTVNGYNSVKNIISGDDELLLDSVFKKRTAAIKFIFEREAAVATEGIKSLRELWEQRKRWASKCIFYGTKRKLVLINFYLFYVLLLLIPVICILKPILILPFFMIYLNKFLFDYLLINHSMKVLGLNIKNWKKYFIFAEFFHIPLIVFSSLAGTFGKFTWKDNPTKARFNLRF